MTTAAKGAAASAISYCLVRCSVFSELPLCSIVQYDSSAQLPRWLVVSEGYIRPHHFLSDIQQLQILTSFLLLPLLLHCLENVMFAQLRVESAQVN